MKNKEPQYEIMPEHFMLCFNDIVVCRKKLRTTPQKTSWKF